MRCIVIKVLKFDHSAIFSKPLVKLHNKLAAVTSG